VPNGGVPIHMALKPRRGGGHVLYCHGARLHVLTETEWEKAKTGGTPLVYLDSEECLILERFLRYWLSDQQEGPIYNQLGIEVEYDF
jgi:hypothetical protein